MKTEISVPPLTVYTQIPLSRPSKDVILHLSFTTLPRIRDYVR